MCSHLPSAFSARQQQRLPVWSLLNVTDSQQYWMPTLGYNFFFNWNCLNWGCCVCVPYNWSARFGCTQTEMGADGTPCARECWNQLAYFWLQTAFGKASSSEMMISAFDPSRKQNSVVSQIVTAISGACKVLQTAQFLLSYTCISCPWAAGLVLLLDWIL